MSVGPFTNPRSLGRSSKFAQRIYGHLEKEYLHTTVLVRANPLPVTAAGPPPSAPIPAASQYGERNDRRRRQAEMLQRGQELRASQTKPGNAMKKRFWKDVTVRADSGASFIRSNIEVVDIHARRVRSNPLYVQTEITQFISMSALSAILPTETLYPSRQPNPILPPL